MRSVYSYLSWALLALSLIAFVGVGYFAKAVLAEAHVRAAMASDAGQAVARKSYNDRLRSIAVETEAERMRLDTLAGRDIVSIVDTVERAGEVAGIPLTVSSALSGGEGEELPGGSRLRPVIFVLDAEGSYTKILRTISLLENLPLPSLLDEVSITRSGQEGSGQQWRASVRLRVYTTTTISS